MTTTKPHYTLLDLKIDLMRRKVMEIWDEHLRECRAPYGPTSTGYFNDEGCPQDEELRDALRQIEALEDIPTARWYKREAWLAEHGVKSADVMEDEKGEFFFSGDEENSKVYVPVHLKS